MADDDDEFGYGEDSDECRDWSVEEYYRFRHEVALRVEERIAAHWRDETKEEADRRDLRRRFLPCMAEIWHKEHPPKPDLVASDEQFVL